MKFKSTVLPGVRAFVSTMRVKPCRERPLAARSGTPFSSTPSRAQAHLRTNWRVCPITGRLQQRWSVDESQDPQSRRFA